MSIDEISYKKRHKYLTLVLDLEHTHVVWVREGRSQTTLEGFFDEIGEENARGIEAIAMNMWDPYLAAIEAKSPQAAIIFDKIHVIRNYSRVIDRVRNDEIKKAESEDKPILRGTKYLLLKNWENLSEGQRSRLDTLLSLNNNLNTVYILKEDLKRLWECDDKKEAEQVLVEWNQAAEESGIKALIDFARMLNRYSFGLLNHCQYPINNARLEGFNNKIKVIKRRCYDFHDLEYFTLKIKLAVALDHPPW